MPLQHINDRMLKRMHRLGDRVSHLLLYEPMLAGLLQDTGQLVLASRAASRVWP